MEANMHKRKVTQASANRANEPELHEGSIADGVPVSQITTGAKSLEREKQKAGTKSISLRKLLANRRNLQKSTGPNTARGKSQSRRNAQKHGILSVALLVSEGPGAENAAEFQKHLHCLRCDWTPEGYREEMLVEEIAICDWRMARALRCEAGLVSRGFVNHHAGPPPELSTLRIMLSPEAEAKRERELNAITDHLSLPLGKPLDRLTHYQTTIQRLKALKATELERLQLQRKGTNGPPV
jgi:hypothetical protein